VSPFRVSRRPGFAWTTLTIDDPWEMGALRLLDRPHSRSALTRKLADRRPGLAEDDMTALLGRWLELGLVFTDGGQHVLTAAIASNQELIRVKKRGAGRSTRTPSPALVIMQGR